MLFQTDNTLRLGAGALVASFAYLWFHLVCETVPDPYLDEVFHVRQADNYVKGNWHIWDPKITTPPGLYVVSYLFAIPWKAFRLRVDTTFFRSVNQLGAILLAWVVYQILHILYRNTNHDREDERISKDAGSTWCPTELAHIAINICLFPPLFFFYGLYYTDVLSAVSVLLVYKSFLEDRHSAIIIAAGLFSLLFRQTNVLWVAIFLGGLAFCRAISKRPRVASLFDEPTVLNILQATWRHASAYDPPISEASFEDYIKAGLSFAVAGFASGPNIVWSLGPYLVILGVFVQYILWNGGVVLGDKENHVVSIHLAQMLYLWPCFAFFSLPLLYPYLTSILPNTMLPSALRLSSIKSNFPRLVIAVPVIAIMLAIAHYNTLIHPFTLADNRHYTFYVFRILLRHPSLKYLAVPTYLLCAWAAIAALGGPNAHKQQPTPKKPSKQRRQDTAILPSSPASDTRVSFLLIWLLATAASLITTPLVEPRYWVVPWLMWRLHIAPLGLDPPTTPSTTNNRAGSGDKVKGVFEKFLYSRMHDHRLWLETGWLLAINMATGYIFLKWGFEWPQEPGKVQRFMW